MNAANNKVKVQQIQKKLPNNKTTEIKVISAQNPVNVTKNSNLFAIDFDNTIVRGHLHNHLVHLNYRSDNQVDNQAIQEFLENNKDTENKESLQQTFQKIINDGHQPVIVSFSSFPSGIKMALDELIGPELANQVTIVTGNHTDLSARSNGNKNPLIEVAQKQLGMQNIDNSKVLLFDDSKTNIKTARNKGYNAHNVSAKGIEQKHLKQRQIDSGTLNLPTLTDTVQTELQKLEPAVKAEQKEEPTYQNIDTLQKNRTKKHVHFPEDLNELAQVKEYDEPEPISEDTTEQQPELSETKSLVKDSTNKQPWYSYAWDKIKSAFHKATGGLFKRENKDIEKLKTPDSALDKTGQKDTLQEDPVHASFAELSTPNKQTILDLNDVGNTISKNFSNEKGVTGSFRDAMKSTIKNAVIQKAQEIGIADAESPQGKMKIEFASRITTKQKKELLSHAKEVLSALTEHYQKEENRQGLTGDKGNIKAQIKLKLNEIKKVATQNDMDLTRAAKEVNTPTYSTPNKTGKTKKTTSEQPTLTQQTNPNSPPVLPSRNYIDKNVYANMGDVRRDSAPQKMAPPKPTTNNKPQPKANLNQQNHLYQNLSEATKSIGKITQNHPQKAGENVSPPNTPLKSGGKTAIQAR